MVIDKLALTENKLDNILTFTRTGTGSPAQAKVRWYWFGYVYRIRYQLNTMIYASTDATSTARPDNNILMPDKFAHKAAGDGTRQTVKFAADLAFSLGKEF